MYSSGSLCLYEISADFGEFHPGAKGRKKLREGRDSGERPTLITVDEISHRFTFCLRQMHSSFQFISRYSPEIWFLILYHRNPIQTLIWHPLLGFPMLIAVLRSRSMITDSSGTQKSWAPEEKTTPLFLLCHSFPLGGSWAPCDTGTRTKNTEARNPRAGSHSFRRFGDSVFFGKSDKRCFRNKSSLSLSIIGQYRCYHVWLRYLKNLFSTNFTRI